MKKKRNYWLKGAAFALALIMAIPVLPAMPAQAASKKMTVAVKSPKSGVKLSGSKLAIHNKKAVQLTVKSGRSNVTAKASLKSSSPKVISVRGGQLVPKKNGKATVTVKYKGTAKKLNITVGGHSWKAHKKTKTIDISGIKCVCGKVVTLEKKDCERCKKYSYCGKNGWCCCKQSEHTRNHILKGEPSNYYLISVPKKVKYIDYYKCSCGAKKKGEAEPK